MQAPNPQFAETLKKIVLAMPMAQLLRLQFLRVEPGEVDVEIPYSDGLSFRPGQFQATPIFAAADFAAIAASGTLLPIGWINATIDCTLKVLAPAAGDRLIARGRVVTPGRLVTVCAADVYAVRDGQETHCATALATARNIDMNKA